MVYNSQSQLIELKEQIGTGGEGNVFSISGNTHVVAKIYHKTPSQEKADKLSAMVKVKTERLAKLSAWPVDTLHSRSKGATVGILMPKISGYKDIHQLYGPKTRMNLFPDKGWDFLIHTATNLATAFDSIHSHGHVIGDVNHSNIVVAPDGIVKMIDCDSFQICSDGRKYLCEVGVMTHQPPEFQSLKSFRGVVRNKNHDNFGLAVLIFQLIFMGRHPFAGQYNGPGENSLTRAIEEHRFAYGPHGVLKQMKPPPGSLPFSAVSPRVQALFEQAFLTNKRPEAKEWITALEELRRNLIPCRTNAYHKFVQSLVTCPWCEIEGVTGVRLFNFVVCVNQQVGGFRIDAIQLQIKSLKSPGAAPPLPALSSFYCQAEAQYIKYGSVKKSIDYAITAGFVTAAIVMFIPDAFMVAVLIGLIALAAKYHSDNYLDSDLISDARRQLNNATHRLDNSRTRWENEASDGVFISKKAELEKLCDRYRELEAAKQKRLNEYRDNRRKYELEKYLEKYPIYDARIDGIGPTRTAVLQSYGIETAADIEYHRIMSISGFGPTYTSNLVDWRKRIERGFVFDQSRILDQSIVLKIEKEIRDEKAKLEVLIRNGLSDLNNIKSNIENRRKLILPEVTNALKDYAQAKANWDALNIST